MKKYMLVDSDDRKQYNAAGKGMNDVYKIASGSGFEIIPVKRPGEAVNFFQKVKRKFVSYINWEKIYNHIERESIVLLIWPFNLNYQFRTHTYLKLKKRKKVKFIVLTFDIFEIADGRDGGFFDMCAIPDILIVHNDDMKQWLIEHGVDEEKMVCIEIFDYLRDDDKDYCLPKFEKSITLAAGDVSPICASYAYEFDRLPGIKVNIYGKNYDTSLIKSDNVFYCGCVPGEELPDKLTSGFGLVWYCKSLEESENDDQTWARYLKYNNPNRLSLYLSSGLPVVIWNKAATAKLIKKYNLGITVNSPLELPGILENMTEEEYSRMALNVSEIAKKLRKGFFTETAIEKAIEKLR